MDKGKAHYVVHLSTYLSSQFLDQSTTERPKKQMGVLVYINIKPVTYGSLGWEQCKYFMRFNGKIIHHAPT